MHPLVLAPGDPARAMAIATAQLEEPRMFNHRRGLWGYSGRTPDGLGVVVQSTGMGGPSAAIVCEELAELGAKTIVRVGTCGAIDPLLRAGDLVVADSAFADDGASQALVGATAGGASGGAGNVLAGDVAITEALAACGERLHDERSLHRGRVASVDLFYDPAASDRHARLRGQGALALEMEAATLFAVAARRGIRAACLLGVTDELWGDERKRLHTDQLTTLGDLLGEIAVHALEPTP
jgi:DeoD family purine-nucleoside phosphorylase